MGSARSIRGRGAARRALLVVAMLASLLAVSVGSAPTVAGADPAPPRLASGGGNHSCATNASGALVCWGFNLYGQIDVPSSLGAPKAVDVGAFHTCAIGADDLVSCWGATQNGATNVPSDVGAASSISAGTYVTCAVRTAGTLRCWGSSGYSSEGVPPSDLGTVSSVSVGVEHTCAVTTSGTARCWGLNSRGRATVPGDLGTVTSISAGSDHTCAVQVGGGLRCWGSNDEGQLDVPEDLGPVQSVVAGGLQTCALTDGGAVRCWGNDFFGQSTPPSGTYRSLSGALYTHCAITTDEALRCWGAPISAGSAPATPSPAPPNGIVGQAYSHALTSSRGAPQGSFAVTGGSLPAGLTLSPAGVLAGTPEAAGSSTFTVGIDGGVFPAASATFTVSVRALEPPTNVAPPVLRGLLDRPRATRPITVTTGDWVPAGPTFAYRWLRSVDGTAWEPIPGATTARYTPTLANDLGQLLRAEVTATNGDGSTTASVTTARTVGVAPGTAAAPKPPAEPTNVAAIGFGTDGNMLVSWRLPFQNGAALTSMNVRVVPTSGPSPAPTVLPANTTRTQVTCPTTALTCTIEVWGTNSAGLGEVATVVGSFQPPDPPQTPAASIKSGAVEAYNISLVTPRDMGGLQVTEYRYDVSIDGGPFGAPQSVAIDPLTLAGKRALSTLPCPGGRVGCVYRLYAVNPAGASEPSRPTAFRPFTPPAAPRIAVTRTATPGLLRVAITPPANTGGLPLTGFRVTSSVDSSSDDAAVVEVGPTATEAFIPCPNVAAQCTVAVTGETLVGRGAPALRTISYTSIQPFVPAPPAVIPTAVDLPTASTSVRVEWLDPPLATATQARSLIYQLRACDDVAECPVVTPTVTRLPNGRWSASVSCPATRLAGCAVQVRATSVNGGFAPWSFTTVDQILRPRAPQAITATDLGGGLVGVSWTLGPVGAIGDELASWRVFRCETSSGCDAAEDFVPVGGTIARGQLSVQDQCGGGVTCRYLAYGVTADGRPGHVGLPTEVTTFDG